MAKIVIDHSKCKLSGECVKVCPEKAISAEGGIVLIDYAKCDLDGMCIPACPHGAISLIEDDE